MKYWKLTYRFPAHPTDGEGVSYKFGRNEKEAKDYAQKALRAKALFTKVEVVNEL